MLESSFNASTGRLPQDRPVYLPLKGQAAKHALEVLLRKGAMLEPHLTSSEAQQILSFMQLEHLPADTLISYQAQNSETARLMMILAGEANIRMRSANMGTQSPNSLFDQSSRWFSAGEGATLGLIHVFGGLSSRFVAQSCTELFVASMPRYSLHAMKKQSPAVALRYFEMLLLEMALVALDHERQLHAMNSVARSMQSHIDDQSEDTLSSPLV
jgi:hypothetical protein